ncbi:hypothetical protein BHAMNSH16_07405 [Brachyspira hampsonii]|uniref:DUF3592 domain-containing protein n=2 Tax=Brachyspira hampsonii TaxID=1287055 RepID=A0AAC9TX80_9SPIR|nr:hypothetical protein [Brachyspira hampsonii]ASJ22787.1 hypothetical protein BHAMNSH16_07405 [Brachyspira hampsonii]MBW5380183.1 hypothetical protein [Brachyspira hampsonii]OEJ17489.1 hypothetical protein A9496_11290 [Brachyspira hampsonii]
MDKKIYRIIIFIAGIFLFAGGIIGIFSIFIGTKNYIHTVCIVEQYNSKKVYKHRKIRYENTMVISYDTDKYGKLYTTLKSYYHFRKVGDKLILWYNHEKPRDIKLPFSECILYTLFILFGLIFISLYIITIKK